MNNASALALGIALAVLGSSTVARAQDHSPIKVTRLTERILLLSTDQGEYTTNTLAFSGEDGLLLVDTQTEEEAGALKAAVDSLGLGPPTFIINTHRHIEHVGGNAIFGDAPIVIAHELVPAKLRSGSFIFNEFPAATFPDITVADSMSLYFNGERIRIVAMPGSHDDNEIIVHFTESKVVHLSSLVNGFNFPSIDSDGDVLKFAGLVQRAIEILPRDVVIVSGHNDVGTWQDLHHYRDMLIETTEVVGQGLNDGKDVETLQKEGVLDRWKEYAGSYVSTDEWIKYLARALKGREEPGLSVFEPLYRRWKEKGAESAVALYAEFRRDHADEYSLKHFDLLIVGDKLLARDINADAAVFLQASLEEWPESEYGYYTAYRLAYAYRRLGNTALAVESCRKALELNPDFQPASELLAEIQ